MIRIPLKAAIAAGVALAFAAAVPAQARTLKIQTSSNASHFSLAHLKDHWVPKLKERTGGKLELDLLPIKAVVPHTETPKAIAKGILDGDLTAVSYFSGKDPAFALIGDLIAGYDSAAQVLEYCLDGGGRQMLQKLWDKYQPGIQVVGCGAYGREAFVSKVPIRSVADMKGKKIRSPEGLAAEVFRRVGAAPVSLPGSEIYSALEKNVIDAADNSVYANNDANGMHKVAKFPIYPGIHSTPVLQFTISKKAWNSLSKQEQDILVQWYREAYLDLMRVSDEKDKALVARDKAGKDITVVDWPQAERDKFREVAKGAWEAFAASSDLAKETYATHVAFMKRKGLLK